MVIHNFYVYFKSQHLTLPDNFLVFLYFIHLISVQYTDTKLYYFNILILGYYYTYCRLLNSIKSRLVMHSYYVSFNIEVTTSTKQNELTFIHQFCYQVWKVDMLIIVVFFFLTTWQFEFSKLTWKKCKL